MLCLRTKIFFLLISLPLFLSNRVVSAQQSSLNSQQVERLTKMAELWGTVKYFHPYLAYRDINWDSAMVAVLPHVLEAEDSESYANAIESLLSVLDDPSTYVAQSATEQVVHADFSEPVVTWTADSILVATLNERTLDLFDYVMVFQRLGKLRSELRKAKGIVFDMRSESGLEGPESLEDMIQYFGIENDLTTTPLLVPGQRFRIHSGFATEQGAGSPIYGSAFHTTNNRLIEPSASSYAGPIVFLVNQSGHLPSFAAALQDAGLAAIVSDGPFSGAPLINTHPIEIGKDITVHIRTTELVRIDGTTGLRPNLILSISTSEEGVDYGLEEALKLAREFNPEKTPTSNLTPAAITKWGTYSDELYPSRSERALAAFKVWYVIKKFFPYHELMDQDWDEVFHESLASIVDAPDSRTYHLAIAKMFARIQDSHGTTLSPVLWRHLINARSPLFLQWIEEQPVVVGFRDPEAAQEAGIEIGDVVLEIDGLPASERIGQIIDYFAASTPQALMRRVMRVLLGGPDSSTVSLKLSGKNNQVKSVRLRRLRSYNPGIKPSRTDEVLQVLPSNIGYADLDRLTVPQVEEMFERFKDTRAIIFDMRGYPNGTAWSIAPYLAREPEIEVGYYSRNLLFGPDEESHQTYEAFTEKIPASVPGKHYEGLTVMLIDEHVQSQSEYTGMFFEAANGTVFIGSHTSGAIGPVTFFSIPGNINLRFSGQSVRYPDDRQVQRLGLVPKVEVRPTINGLRSGRDEVLEAALKYIEETLRLD